MGDRRSSALSHYKRKNNEGYDINVTAPRPQDAVFLPKEPKYQRFWRVWGCRLKKKTWKREKVLNRREYLTMLIAVLPGIWYHNIGKMVIEVGGTHIFQIGVLSLILTVPLLYGETFLADYTKTTNSRYWRAMPFSYCFFPLQVMGIMAESFQGLLISVMYLSHIKMTLMEKERLTKCPTEKTDKYICYDHNIHAISQRCNSGGIWVTCPDNSTYILPAHLFFYKECALKTSLISWDVAYVLVHWFFMLCIAFRGVRRFVRLIQITILGSLFIRAIFLIVTSYVCSSAALRGITLILGVKMENLFVLSSWKAAFLVAIDMATWALPMNTAIASGLVFRTSRWTDSMLVVLFAYLVAIFMTAANFTVTACVASKLNTRIETIFKPLYGRQHVTQSTVQH